MDAVTGSIIAQTGASAINSAGSFLSNLFFGERNEEWAREDATTAYERQRQLIDEQRAYDSPQAQMQRFKDAGLNPNLIYGQMSDGGAPVQAPQAQTARAASPDIGLKIPLLESKLMQAQIDRLNTQNKNDTDLTAAEINKMSSEMHVNEWEIKRAEADINLSVARTDEVRQGIENMKQQWAILDEKKQQEAFETAYRAATTDMRIQGTNAEQDAIAKTAVALAMAKVLNVNADTALKWSEKAFNEQYQRESVVRSALSTAQMDVAYRQADLIAAQMTQTYANTRSILYGLAQNENYAKTVYGTSDDTWFQRQVHTFTSSLDAAFKMIGQIGHFTSVTHQ